MSSSRFSYLLSLLFAALCLLAVALLVYPTATTAAERSGIEAAWERAREAGSYQFTADIRQITTPLPTVLNAGRTSKEDVLRLEGEANLPDRQLHMTLWSRGGSVLDASSGVEIKVDGDRAYARQGAQDWEEVNNFAGVFAPQGDFMAYLAAARDVTEHEPETRLLPVPFSSLPLASVTLTRYTFRIDGRSYAAHLRDQMETYLAEQGELPPGVDLDLPSDFADMTGNGELWVSEDGLPLRQILHLQFPPRPDDQQILAEVTVDFSGFKQIPVTSRIAPHVSRFRRLHRAD